MMLIVSLNFSVNSYVAFYELFAPEYFAIILSILCFITLQFRAKMQRVFSIILFSTLMILCFTILISSGEYISRVLGLPDLIFIPIVLLFGIYFEIVQVLFLAVVFTGLIIGGLALNIGELPNETYIYNLYAAPVALGYFLIFAFKAKYHPFTPERANSSPSVTVLFQRMRNLTPLKRMIFWIGFIIFVTPQVLSRQLDLPSEIAVTVMGLGTAICIGILRGQAKKQAQNIECSAPDVVLFRSFDSDSEEVFQRSIALNFKHLLGLVEAETIETFIVDSFPGKAFVAAGNPEGVFDPLGATRAVADSASWQYQISRLIRSTPCLLVSIAGTEGTKWEIQEIFRAGMHDKTLFFGGKSEDLSVEDIRESFNALESDVLDEIEHLICENVQAQRAFAFHCGERQVTWFQSSDNFAEDYRAIFITWEQSMNNKNFDSLVAG